MGRLKITAVALDYGRVVSHPQDAALAKQLRALTAFTEADFAVRYAAPRLAYDRGVLNGWEYWTEVLEHSSVRATPGLLADLVRIDVESWLPLNPDMLKWVDTLKACGISTSLVSNMPADVLQGVRRHHRETFKRFDVTLFSCELGMVKPEREIYDHLMAGLGSLPSETLFVDDQLQNVEAAKRAGLHAIQYESLDQLRRSLAGTYAVLLPGAQDIEQV